MHTVYILHANHTSKVTVAGQNLLPDVGDLLQIGSGIYAAIQVWAISRTGRTIILDRPVEQTVLAGSRILYVGRTADKQFELVQDGNAVCSVPVSDFAKTHPEVITTIEDFDWTTVNTNEDTIHANWRSGQVVVCKGAKLDSNHYTTYRINNIPSQLFNAIWAEAANQETKHY